MREHAIMDYVNKAAGTGDTGASWAKQATEGGVKGPTMTPTAKPPANIHPSAKGVYGAPIQTPILGQRDGT